MTGRGGACGGGSSRGFRMPLFKRKPYLLRKPPKDLLPDEDVFQVRFTKEVFRDYTYPRFGFFLLVLVSGFRGRPFVRRRSFFFVCVV